MAKDDNEPTNLPIEITSIGRRRSGKYRGQGKGSGGDTQTGTGEKSRSALTSGSLDQEPAIKPPAEIVKEGFANAKDAMAGIGKRFTETRSKNRVKAWQQLQTDLMQNMGVMCPYVIAPDKVINTAMQIEDYLKGNETKEGGNPVEVIEKFLNSPVKEMA